MSGPSLRWRALGAYLGALVLTQVFWYNFAPLISLLVSRYGVSELAAGWTVMLFPAASLLFSGHAGVLIDRRGYRYSIALGLTVMALAGVVRVTAGPFWLLLVGQAGAAIAVPYIVTGISNFVTDWFAPEQEAAITGLCTIAIFVGMALALAAPPALVSQLGFRGAMAVLAAISCLWAAVFPFAVPLKPRLDPVHSTPAESGFAPLFRNRNLRVIFASAFLGQGCFNALTTWLEPIWHERGISSAAAGQAGSIVILGGMVGSIVLPRLVDVARRPRLMLWACLVPAAFLVKPFLWAPSIHQGFGWGALMGFLWLPTLAMTLTILERSAGKHQVGAAAGIFWTAGNAGVLGLTVLLEMLKSSTSWSTAMNWLIAMLLVMNILTGFLRPAGRD